MTKFLLLWIESPLQSWGVDSKFKRRETLNFPTKSGILGMLFSAMGKVGEQRELLKRFSTLKHTTISYNNAVQKEELQMIGAGYDDTDDFESMFIPRNKTGKISNGANKRGGIIKTKRFYLQDATFSVILEIDEENVSGAVEGLQNPTFPLFFGRKCCQPSDLIFRGVFNNEEDAILESDKIANDKIANGKKLKKYFTVKDGNEMAITDVPVSFGEKKEYSTRTIDKILE